MEPIAMVVKEGESWNGSGTLRPPAGRQYRIPHFSNHSTDHYQIFSSCYLCQMKAKLKISVHLHMGNYVNQVHHTINTGESREVKLKLILLDLPLYMLVTCYFVS